MNAKDVILARKFGGGGGTDITDGIIVKARDADGYATEVELYSADGIAYPYMFYNGYKASSWNYEQVTWKSCKLLTIKSQLTSIKNSAFTAFPGDIVGDFSQVVDMEHQEGDVQGIPIFDSSGIASISMGSLTVLGGRAFVNCKSLKSAYFPKVTNVYNKWDAGAGRATFGGCSALESIQLGSIGTQCLLSNNQAFLGCTNENLIVTLYCTSQNADTQVAHIRNGATNATIIIKDSTTGETIVTSTP